MAQDPSSEPRLEDLEKALVALPRMDLLGLMPNASNYTFLAQLTGPNGADLTAVYKPRDGESPLWDFPPGTLYRREVAAYRLARRLGWPRVPPTVVRSSAPHGVGALQLFVEQAADGRRPEMARRSDRAWLELSLFDLISNNADRKAGHCLIDGAGEVWGIDHGLTFHPEPKLRTVLWGFSGRRLPRALRPDLERLVEELEEGEAGAEFCQLISEEEVAALTARIASILRPGWRFPPPFSYRSVPWPPF